MLGFLEVGSDLTGIIPKEADHGKLLVVGNHETEHRTVEGRCGEDVFHSIDILFLGASGICLASSMMVAGGPLRIT